MPQVAAGLPGPFLGLTLMVHGVFQCLINGMKMNKDISHYCVSIKGPGIKPVYRHIINNGAIVEVIFAVLYKNSRVQYSIDHRLVQSSFVKYSQNDAWLNWNQD